jgi:hypothetical protein
MANEVHTRGKGGAIHDGSQPRVSRALIHINDVYIII